MQMASKPSPGGSSRDAPGTAAPDPQPEAASPSREAAGQPGAATTGLIHHLELWVPDLDRAVASWGWLLDELGYEAFGDWPGGRSWRAGQTYIVLEQSPDRTASRHDRCRPGLNHLAFHVADTEQLDNLVATAPGNGWRLMFTDRHPHAGGDDHYAAYLENVDGFEAELVAPGRGPRGG